MFGRGERVTKIAVLLKKDKK